VVLLETSGKKVENFPLRRPSAFQRQRPGKDPDEPPRHEGTKREGVRKVMFLAIQSSMLDIQRSVYSGGFMAGAKGQPL
jgi:hypothetical protein